MTSASHVRCGSRMGQCAQASLLTWNWGAMKTIVEHMLDVLHENGCAAVMWGDIHLLDDCATRCTHTSLMRLPPWTRHAKILDALGRSPLFEKSFVSIDLWVNGGWQKRWVRYFKLTGK